MRWALGAVLLAAIAGTAWSASMNADTPGRKTYTNFAISALGTQTFVLTDGNGVSIDWNHVPTVFLYGASFWGGADTLTSTALTALNANGFEDTFWDCDSVTITAGASGCDGVCVQWRVDR